MDRRDFSRRDFLKVGGVGFAGAALLGAAGCAEEETGGAQAGLTRRGSIRIEMPTHMIPPDPNTAIMQNGAEQAANDMGVEVKFRGPDSFDIPQIQQIFETAIASEPDGIAATVPDPDAIGPLVREAVDKGIPVVMFNAGLDVREELGALTYIGQTEYQAGVEAGKRMAEDGVKNALCINHQQGQTALDQRCSGFEEGLGASVRQVAVDGSDPTAIRNGIETALRQNPDVDGLLTLGPDPAAQALKATEAAGKSDAVTVATFDLSPEVLKSVQSEKILFAIDQQMFLQTYLSAVSLITYIQYRLAPADDVPTGPSFVNKSNAQEIIELSGQGIH